MHVHGADRSVTGSCDLVECAGKRILIDCGLHQGSRELDKRTLVHPVSRLRRLHGPCRWFRRRTSHEFSISRKTQQAEQLIYGARRTGARNAIALAYPELRALQHKVPSIRRTTTQCKQGKILLSNDHGMPDPTTFAASASS